MWVEKYPYTAAGILLVAVILFGYGFVSSRTPRATNPAGNHFALPTVTDTTIEARAVVHDAQAPSALEATDVAYRPILTTEPSTASLPSDNSLTDLLNMIAPRKNDYREQDPSIEWSSFLPGGIISLDDIMAQQSGESAAQAEIRAYGNSVGALIRQFESAHPDQWKVIQAYFEDQESKVKGQAQQQLGKDYVELGLRLAAIESIPAAFKSANATLAKSYQALGAKLAAVPFSSDLLGSIEAYNKSAEQFSRDFVSLALLFPAHNVIFASHEGGAVFMMSQGPSL